jgi:hypothetical protein
MSEHADTLQDPIHRVPMTIDSPYSPGRGIHVVIGDQQLQAPTPYVSGAYWILIVDRTNLKVLYSAWWSKVDQAPPVSQWNDPRYMLVVVADVVPTAHLPSGAFYDFLVDNGAGVALSRLIQIYQALNCGTWGYCAYVLVGQMGPGTPTEYVGIEAGSVQANILLTLQLLGVHVDGGLIYTPVRVGS